MIRSHKITYLKQKNIPFTVLDFGLQVDRKYYNFDTFNKFKISFLDTTFIINF